VWRADSRRDLFIAIRAAGIECGAWIDGRWAPLQTCQQPIDPLAGAVVPAQAATSALGELTPRLRQWRDTRADGARTLQSLRVVIAESWLSGACVPWSGALRDPRLARAYARGHLEAAGFAVDGEDEIRLDDAPFGQPRLAVAYPRDLLAALRALADALEIRLASVLPIGAAAWQAAGAHRVRRLACVAVLDDELMSFVQGAGRPGDVSLRGAALGTLDAQWQRMRLRDPQLASVDRLRVLNLGSPDVAAARADLEPIALPQPVEGSTLPPALRLAVLLRSSAMALDPCAGRASVSPLQWGMAAAAAAVAGMLVLQAWQADRDLRAERQQLAAAAALKRPAVQPARWSRDEETRVRAVNTAIRQLNLPISTLLRALQPPADIRVAVLSVDLLAGASGAAQEMSGVRITAEARTGEAMARYVGFVSERKPFVGAYLMRHEIVETAPDRPYRFSVEATWAD
jgi:hypothetical protein